MADANKPGRPGKSGSTSIESPGNGSGGFWELLKSRWILAVLVLAVLITAGIAAYYVYINRSISDSADVRCVIRLTIETKSGAQIVKLTPQDNTLSEAKFDPGTRIQAIQIEGCGGRP